MESEKIKKLKPGDWLVSNIDTKCVVLKYDSWSETCWMISKEGQPFYVQIATLQKHWDVYEANAEDKDKFQLILVPIMAAAGIKYSRTIDAYNRLANSLGWLKPTCDDPGWTFQDYNGLTQYVLDCDLETWFHSERGCHYLIWRNSKKTDMKPEDIVSETFSLWS